MRDDVMKRILLVLLVTAFGLSGEVRAQEPAPDAARRIVLRLDAGGSGAALSQVREIFTSTLAEYRAAGVPVQLQRDFPMGATLRGAVLTSVSDRLMVGLSVGGASTSAVSLYGDYAGTLDVRARTTALFANITAEYRLSTLGDMTPFLGVEGGFMHVRTRFEQRVAFRYEDLQTPVSSKYELSAVGVGYNVGVVAGVRYPIGPISVVGQAGYRRAMSSKAYLVERIDGASRPLGRGVSEQDMSGVHLTVGIALGL